MVVDQETKVSDQENKPVNQENQAQNSINTDQTTVKTDGKEAQKPQENAKKTDATTVNKAGEDWVKAKMSVYLNATTLNNMRTVLSTMPDVENLTQYVGVVTNFWITADKHLSKLKTECENFQKANIQDQEEIKKLNATIAQLKAELATELAKQKVPPPDKKEDPKPKKKDWWELIGH